MAPTRPSRSTVYGRNGMVCSASPLAASTGIRVLQEGGNAFDAALALAAVEAVTLPSKCSIGGDTFAILYQPPRGSNKARLRSMSSSGVAPTGATSAYYQSKGHEFVPRTGPLAATVPGSIAAWETMHREYCTMPFAKLIEPAIGYAEDGYPVTPRIAREFKIFAETLAEYPSTASVLLKDGQPYQAGDVLVQSDLAASLKKVAQGGADEYYRGSLTQQLIKGLQASGGLFTQEDFANHTPQFQEPPLSGTYRGHTIYETSFPSQGFIVLSTLNILEGFDMSSLGHNTPESVHLMVEAKKLAYADRNTYAGDPSFVSWPLERLLSKEHAEEQRKRIDHNSAATTRIDAPAPVAAGNDTAYSCIVDSEGNAVSYIHSIFAGFGSQFIVEGTGILMNNRATSFYIKEGHPNTIAPGKRTMHTLNCYMVFKDDLPVIVGGTPGADNQPQSNVQVLTSLIDYGMELQQAVDAPRWNSTPGTNPRTVEDDYVLQMEQDAPLPEETIEGLQSKGHKITTTPADLFGRVNLLAIDHERGILAGASDPRADGEAIPL